MDLPHAHLVEEGAELLLQLRLGGEDARELVHRDVLGAEVGVAPLGVLALLPLLLRVRVRVRVRVGARVGVIGHWHPEGVS